ncbi:MAG: CDP-alcohol phosphatidyltransferase family protein, partial [Candidatus Zixiibacteriota bacterium]
MNRSENIVFRDIALLPNLLSVFRIALTPPVGYLLWRGDDSGTLLAVFLLAVAGLTDLLDGFLARRLDQVTALGKIMDPLADKIFTVVLIIELVYFRLFPVWLAAAIIVRDLVIVILGSLLLRGKKADLQSNLTGKYYFFSVVMLMGSFILRFEFGQMLFLPITAVLLVLSGLNYGWIFAGMLRGRGVPVFSDRP